MSKFKGVPMEFDGHKMLRIDTSRCDFAYEHYIGAQGTKMLHLHIWSRSGIQVDLWLDNNEQEVLQTILEERNP